MENRHRLFEQKITLNASTFLNRPGTFTVSPALSLWGDRERKNILAGAELMYSDHKITRVGPACEQSALHIPVRHSNSRVWMDSLYEVGYEATAYHLHGNARC